MKNLTIEQMKNFKRIIRKRWRKNGATDTRFEELYDRLCAAIEVINNA